MRQHLSFEHLVAGRDSRRAALAVVLHQPRIEFVSLFPNARSHIPGEALILSARLAEADTVEIARLQGRTSFVHAAKHRLTTHSKSLK
jgi:hypothetical protein